MAQSRQNFSHRDGGHHAPGTPIGRGMTAEPVNGSARHYDDTADGAADFEVRNDGYARERYRGNGVGDHQHDQERYDRGRRGNRDGSESHSGRYAGENGHDEYGRRAARDGEVYDHGSYDHETYDDDTSDHDTSDHDPMPDHINDSGGRMSVSILLREAREDAGYSLRDVSSILRIRLAHLESIEDGRFDDLPGTVYAVGFVRAYSDLVGLDGEAMVKRFKEEVSGVPDQTELHFPTPTSEGRVPGLGLVTIAVLLAGVAYGGWYYVSEADRGVGDFIPALPDRFAGLLDGWTGETPPIDEIADGSTGDGSELDGEGAQGRDAQTGLAENGADADPDAVPGAVADTATDPALPTVPSATDDDGAATTPPGDVAASPGVDASGSDPSASGAPIDPTGSSGVLAGRDVAEPDPQDPDTQAPDTQAPDTQAGDGGETSDEQAATDLENLPDDSDPSADAVDPPDLGNGDDPQSPSVLASETPSDSAVAVPGFDDPALADSDADSAENELGGATPNSDETAAGENGVDDGGQQVLIRAESDSWVQIRDSVGSLLMTRVMRAGEVYEVPDEPGLTMVTGNAGGLQVTVGGESAPALGGAGDVVRGIRLEPDALLEGSAGP